MKESNRGEFLLRNESEQEKTKKMHKFIRKKIIEFNT